VVFEKSGYNDLEASLRLKVSLDRIAKNNESSLYAFLRSSTHPKAKINDSRYSLLNRYRCWFQRAYGHSYAFLN
jgi:hypothetical protein